MVPPPFSIRAHLISSIQPASLMIQILKLLRFPILARLLFAAFILVGRLSNAGEVGTVVVGSQSPSPVCPGSSASYTVTLTRSGNGAITAALTVSGLPTGAIGLFSPNPVIFNPADNSTNSTLTITTTAGIIVG